LTILADLISKLDKLVLKLAPYIPFSNLNTVWRSLDKSGKTILDVGCGVGRPMKFFNKRKRFSTVGVDIFTPSLKECKKQGTHDDYILCDARSLPFRRDSFDVVISLEVLEHMEKKEGEQFLQSLEEIARRQVVISTPVGIYEQGVNPKDGNPHWVHQSTWEPAELKVKGYKVRGVGLRNLSGEAGLTSRLPRLLKPLHFVVWILAGPFTYFLPKFSGHMICIKKSSIP